MKKSILVIFLSVISFSFLALTACTNEKQRMIDAAAPAIEKEIKELLASTPPQPETAAPVKTVTENPGKTESGTAEDGNRVKTETAVKSSAAPVTDGKKNPAAEQEVPETADSQTGTPYYNLADRTEFPPLKNKAEYLAWMKARTNEEEQYLIQRWDRMQVDLSWYPTGTSDRVQQAFLRTPREHFIRKYNLARTYDSWYHVIEDGQTISGPHIVIRMTQTIEPSADMKVLEIGMGSGYQSAFLSNLSNQVYTIEIKANLYRVTDEIYKSLENEYPWYKNVHRKNDDGYYGWPEHAPFDRIIVTCAIDHIPPPLIDQLAPGGVMVIPVGPISGQQTLLKVTKEVDEEGTVRILREDVYGGKQLVKFVPFTDKAGGWHSEKK